MPAASRNWSSSDSHSMASTSIDLGWGWWVREGGDEGLGNF
jgi:hypothetical protein